MVDGPTHDAARPMASSVSAALAVVRWALNEAISRTAIDADAPSGESSLSKQSLSAACGKGWIAALHDAFSQVYAPHADDACGRVRVFSRTKPSEIVANGKAVWEVLHDVLVAETVVLRSAGNREDLVLIRRPIWQVESEIHVSSREVGWDLSKLCAGGAPFKLLITSERANRMAFDRFINGALTPSGGTVFVAYIPSYAPSTVGFARWFRGSARRPTFMLTRFANGRVDDLGEDTGSDHDGETEPAPA